MSGGNVVEIGVRVKMDGSGFVGQMQGMRGELAGMATANQAAAASAGALTAATAATAAANDELVQAFRQSNAALQTAMQAIIANTAATNQGIGALVAGATASRERADAANNQAAAERNAAAAANDNAEALRKAATEVQQYASMAAQLRSAIDPMYAAQQRFNQQLDAAELLLEKGVITEREYASALAMARQQLQDHAKAVAGNNSALNENVAANNRAAAALANGGVSLGQARAGYINLGRQMQDVAVMAQGGMSLGSIISTQGGQIADAVAQMGGRFAGLASFLAGPWGAAVFVGASMLANLVSSLLETGDASSKAENKTYDFSVSLDVLKLKSGEAANAMKQLEEATKSAIKTQGDFLAMMGQTATASVAALEQRITENRTTVKSLQDSWLSLSNLNPLVAIWKYRQIGVINDQIATDEKALKDAKAAQVNVELASSQRKVNSELDAATAATTKYDEAVGKLNALRRASIADPVGKALDGTYLSKSAYEDQYKALSITHNKALEAAREAKKKHPDQTDALANFSDGAETRISNIADQFSDLPPAVERANKSLRDLDGIIADVERKGAKLGDGPKLIAEATAAKAKVQAGLSRTLIEQIETIGAPYSTAPAGQDKAAKSLSEISKIVDYVTAHSGDIINSGKILADAAMAKAAIEDSLNKPFQDYLKAQAEQTAINKLIVGGRQDEADALRVILDLQKKQQPLSEGQAAQVLEIVRNNQLNTRVLRDQQALIQANVSAATNMRTALNETVAETLKGRGSFDKILSSIGNSYVNIMSQRIVESLFGNSLRAFEDEATRNFRAATEASGDAILRLGDAAAAAAGRIGGSKVGAPVGLSGTDPVAQLFDSVLGKKASNDNGVPVTTGNDIVVPGRRSKSSDVAGVASPLLGLTNSLFRGLGINIPDGITKGLKPLFTKLETALPDAVQGAMLGGTASRLINGGGAGSGIGGTIGGAIGAEMGKKFLSSGLNEISSGLGKIAGPLGGIIGGVLGGMLGGLFTPTKAGTTVITGANKASTTASTQEVSAGLTNMGNSITSALEAVANKFNTTVGDFSVSIGQYKDYFRVSASGSSRVGDKYYPNTAGSDILYDGTDQATATLIAIQNAIADGAVRGLSKAVQKALSSSSNIESAVNEALKVQEVELAIGGIGAQLQKAFREDEQTAQERLRIAKQYGFDMVATEKVNAEARAALNKKLLEDQVGSLQQILDEMSSGALFEGSAVDQRAAILAKITTAKADVAAGKDGASDTLAKLLEQLNTVSKEAFGTTAQYQADRAMIADVARDAITAANQRISDAAAMATAQAQTNSALDEANDQLSRMAALLGMTVDYLKQMVDQGYISTSALADLAKTS